MILYVKIYCDCNFGVNFNMVGVYYVVFLYINKSVFCYVNIYCILFLNGNMIELIGNIIVMFSIVYIIIKIIF